MSRIGTLIPVTPVPLACAAIQASTATLFARAAGANEECAIPWELNGRVVHDGGVSDFVATGEYCDASVLAITAWIHCSPTRSRLVSYYAVALRTIRIV